MIYALWDTGMTMGCRCDAGYTGPDCSGKACKYGVDPLYIDDDATARVSEQHYTIGGGSTATYPDDVVSGTYAIKFYDVFGEDYLTEPIKINTDSIISGEGCNDVVTALEGLPNTVIPKSSVICSASQIYKTTSSTSAQSYALTFTGNPGYLKPLTIDTYLDGYRETVKPTGTGETTVTTTNKGISGEFVDYFASKCEGVTVQFVELDLSAFIGSAEDAFYDTYYSYELNGDYYLDVVLAFTGKRGRELTTPAVGLRSRRCVMKSDPTTPHGQYSRSAAERETLPHGHVYSFLPQHEPSFYFSFLFQYQKQIIITQLFCYYMKT